MIFDIDYSKIQGKKVAGIYKITNLKNNKVYIGQSKHLRHRISDYVNIHTKSNMNHPIAEAIKKDGTDNFKFEILHICENDKLSAMEEFYIKKFKATDDKYGYNQIMHTTGVKDSTRNNMRKSHTGLKESAETKRKKSNIIFIFSPDHKQLIISDSGKLFGDYIGKSKDMIKNGLREPSRILGYYLYYADLAKREFIYEKMLQKRSVRNLQFLTDVSILNNLMKEGVETIYRSFNVYKLSYDNLDKNGRPILTQISNGYDYSHQSLTDSKIELVINLQENNPKQ